MGTLWKQVYLFQRFYDKVNRREYVHGTAHQKSGKKSTDRKDKELQMDQIRNILEKFKGVPVIYSADVNTAEGTPCFKRFPSDLLPRSSYPKDSERVSAIKFRKSGPQLEKQGVLDKQMIDCIKHNRGFKTVRYLQLPTFEDVNVATGGTPGYGSGFKNNHAGMPAADDISYLTYNKN